MYNALQLKSEEAQQYLGFAIHYKEREEQYLEVINRYGKEEQLLFAEAFGLLVECIDIYAQEGQPVDVLGPIFHELELHNKYKGQFFTPQNISDMMALMTVGTSDPEIEKNGYVNATDPACGSGVMMLSFAKALNKAKYDYRIHCCITCVDIDIKCVWMAYIQLALYGIPAVVIHGNTLTTEEWGRWYTPTYILDKWIWRERCGITSKFHPEDEALKCMEPAWLMYKAFRELFPTEPKQESEQATEQEPEIEEYIEVARPKQISLDIQVKETNKSGVKYVRRQRKKEKTEGIEQINLFE